MFFVKIAINFFIKVALKISVIILIIIIIIIIIIIHLFNKFACNHQKNMCMGKREGGGAGRGGFLPTILKNLAYIFTSANFMEI